LTMIWNRIISRARRNGAERVARRQPATRTRQRRSTKRTNRTTPPMKPNPQNGERSRWPDRRVGSLRLRAVRRPLADRPHSDRDLRLMKPAPWIPARR
jgi:hypothetical protein